MKSFKSVLVTIVAALSIALVFLVNMKTACATPSPTVCVQDPVTLNYITWNTATGAYTFQECSTKGSPIMGAGQVKLVDGIQYLTDNKSTIKLSAAFLTGQLTGKATVNLIVAKGITQTVSINATMPGMPCACIPMMESASGSVSILVFLGLVLVWFAWRVFSVTRPPAILKRQVRNT